MLPVTLGLDEHLKARGEAEEEIVSMIVILIYSQELGGVGVLALANYPEASMKSSLVLFSQPQKLRWVSRIWKCYTFRSR